MATSVPIYTLRATYTVDKYYHCKFDLREAYKWRLRDDILYILWTKDQKTEDEYYYSDIGEIETSMPEDTSIDYEMWEEEDLDSKNIFGEGGILERK